MRMSTISGSSNAGVDGNLRTQNPRAFRQPSALQMRVHEGNENNSKLPPSRVSATTASFLLQVPLFLLPSKPVMVPFVAAR